MRKPFDDLRDKISKEAVAQDGNDTIKIEVSNKEIWDILFSLEIAQLILFIDTKEEVNYD